MIDLKSTLKIAAGLACVALLAGIVLAEENVTPQKKMSPAETAVRAVVQQHIDGIVQADIEKLQAAWDTKAGRINFMARGKDGRQIVQSAPIAESFKMWTQSKSRGARGAIQSVDVVNNNMAMAKARIVFGGEIYDDYLVLLKTGGDWKLVSKTYTSQSTSPYAAFAP